MIIAWQPEAQSRSCSSQRADPNARVCRQPALDPMFAPARTRRPWAARSWAARGHKSASSSSRRSGQSPRRESIRGVRPSVRPRRLPWADLLKRIFGVDALQCECGHSMRVIAAITEPTVAKAILKCMGLPPRAPPLEPARMSGFAADAWLEEAGAAGFDQSPPDDWLLGA